MPVRRTFTDERTLGTFHSLGILPKRKHDKQPVFHIHHGDDDDDHSSSPVEHSLPNVPFPRSTSPLSSQSSSSPSPSPSPPSSPQLTRDHSPIRLSNGKPLKSSLKCSSSSPAMLTSSNVQNVHLRARSEPSTPKNVHFPEKDYGLATVCVFNRSARPAALSSPSNGNGDETETEGEEPPLTQFPFPRTPAVNYEIDPTKSSLVPSEFDSSANVLLESLHISTPADSFISSTTIPKPLLTGSILVRNLAFEKHVAVRFTLDDWQTVSEVNAHYVESLETVPSHLLIPSTDTTSQRGKGWDRFTFSIRLEDYAHTLGSRTLWLAVRYRIRSTYSEDDSTECGPGGEWWDNNAGLNYKVGFKPTVLSSPHSRPRRETISAPIPPPHFQTQPPATCKEPVFDLTVPPVPRRKEIQPSSGSNSRHPMPLRTGKLSLCNYAPPTIHIARRGSFPSSHSTTKHSESTTSTTRQVRPDEDSASPTSSNLSTPTVSPTITPHVIIGGQPATPTQPEKASDHHTVIASSKPGHIAHWDWSAPTKSRTAELTCQHPTFTPDSSSGTLYDAFVKKWCFAQGPSGHNPHGDVGIMT